ncbi:hypothetical protein OH782_42450 (plasmid) [Streptomyces sp. NBC_01544]|uniref:hypothetical protein n=1 Tax=Streptomyces sp. NBC_01544 TaxID=2975871 RepID=UPI002F910A62
MTDGWGTVAAAAIAVIGAFVGLFVGRRQVRDQAQVEHGQWLRGQRQEAYSTFLAAWDQAEKNFDGLVNSWEEESSIAREVEWHSGDGWESLGLDWARQTHESEQSVTGPLEAIYLLGPDEVQQRVGNMASALANMRGLLMGIPRLAEQGSADSAWQEHPRLKVAMIEARARFLDASRAVLQTAPDTGRKWFR